MARKFKKNRSLEFFFQLEPDLAGIMKKRSVIKKNDVLDDLAGYVEQVS